MRPRLHHHQQFCYLDAQRNRWSFWCCVRSQWEDVSNRLGIWRFRNKRFHKCWQSVEVSGYQVIWNLWTLAVPYRKAGWFDVGLPVFCHSSKQPEIYQEYSVVRPIFNVLRSAWKCGKNTVYSLNGELINMTRALNKEKQSEPSTRIEPMTSRIPGRRSIYWATRTHGEQGHLTEFIWQASCTLLWSAPSKS